MDKASWVDAFVMHMTELGDTFGRRATHRNRPSICFR
jgi:hypothetical protein